MESIEIDCPNFGPMVLAGDRLHAGRDFDVRSNGGRGKLDYLIFLDSRGVSGGFEGSLADKLTGWISGAGGYYLSLCRPLELTTWATLINFITLNRLNPAQIVTNMGFVDFTPKKQSILEDAIRQVEFLVGKGVAKSYALQHIVSSRGDEIPLYSMAYDGTYRQCIESTVVRQPTVVINSPLVDPEIRVERLRPSSFFFALTESNEFNRSINGAQVVDLPDFDESLTYDAVHYTSRGNEVIFDAIKGYL
jgi:hypothetical protein